jgi:Holliday junction resolvasome RuvABC ATP-dependent DNA helicase subunit
MIDIQKVEARFPKVFGQLAAKKKMNMFLDGYDRNKVLPNIALISSQGGGKTTIARAIGKNLKSSDKSKPHKPFIELIGSTVVSMKSFFESVVLKHMVDKEATIFIDEAHSLPMDVVEAFLAITNPTPTHVNVFEFGDYRVNFDSRLHTFIFASTEAQKLFKPLMNRFERIELEPYTNSELGNILMQNLAGVTIDRNLLEKEIVSVVRGNGREAQKMGFKIKTYLDGKQKMVFDHNDWAEFSDAMGIIPLGLTPLELRVLRIIESRMGTSLTQLSARTGMNPEALRTDVETNLLRLGFVEIRQGQGRTVTHEGQAYLKRLDGKK